MVTAAAEQDLQTKLMTAPLEVKGVDIKLRTFEGLAATWDRDLGHDIIERGAFKNAIKNWRLGNKTLPLLDSHSYMSIRDVVGMLLDIKETAEGLWTKWKVVDGQDGDEILSRLKPDEEGRSFIDSMSIGYRAIKWEMDESEDDSVRILKELDLREVSLVLFPMNTAARIDTSSLKTVADSVKQLVDRAPAEIRNTLRDEIRKAVKARPAESHAVLDKKAAEAEVEQPADPPTPPDPPKQEYRKGPISRQKPIPKSTDEDTGAPDLTKFDQLRLRRLDHFRSATNYQEA